MLGSLRVFGSVVLEEDVGLCEGCLVGLCLREMLGSVVGVRPALAFSDTWRPRVT